MFADEPLLGQTRQGKSDSRRTLLNYHKFFVAVATCHCLGLHTYIRRSPVCHTDK